MFTDLARRCSSQPEDKKKLFNFENASICLPKRNEPDRVIVSYASTSENKLSVTKRATSTIFIDGVRMYQCQSCRKSFKYRSSLYHHKKIHTGMRPFVCDYCYHSFVHKSHLKRHMTQHTGVKNFACDLCMKIFARSDNLQQHRKTHDQPTKKQTNQVDQFTQTSSQ